MFFCLPPADTKIGGMKSKKMQKIQKKMKILASGLTQDAHLVRKLVPALSKQSALSAKTGTYAKRAERTKREYAGPSPLQQL